MAVVVAAVETAAAHVASEPELSKLQPGSESNPAGLFMCRATVSADSRAPGSRLHPIRLRPGSRRPYLLNPRW